MVFHSESPAFITAIRIAADCFNQLIPAIAFRAMATIKNPSKLINNAAHCQILRLFFFHFYNFYWYVDNSYTTTNEYFNTTPHLQTLFLLLWWIGSFFFLSFLFFSCWYRLKRLSRGWFGWECPSLPSWRAFQIHTLNYTFTNRQIRMETGNIWIHTAMRETERNENCTFVCVCVCLCVCVCVCVVFPIHFFQVSIPKLIDVLQLFLLYVNLMEGRGDSLKDSLWDSSEDSGRFWILWGWFQISDEDSTILHSWF